MDPRRARDPRLLRADPRLQRPQSNPPGPPPTSLQQPQLTSGYPAPIAGPSYSQTLPEASPQWSNSPQSNQQLAEEAQAAASGPPATSSYKPRPLFCVVCASNQVRILVIIKHMYRAYRATESVNGGSLCFVVSQPPRIYFPY